MLIGELATRTSVSTRALRHYEKLGMLQSRRGENGYRNYGEESVEWVKSIQFLLSSGLNLATIAQILPTLMGNKCALDDDSVRAAIERESGKIVARMEKMAHSQEVLSKALEKGLLRRPGT
jgi:DNA-binding transcriptional MerR regulator